METTVYLKTFSQPEIYAGVASSKLVWRAESIHLGKGWVPWGSVLGRGETATEAIADWNKRASDDGHKVNGVVKA